MTTNLYLRIPRKIKILVAFIVIILVSFFVLRFLAIKTKNIPSDFLKARQEASIIAQDIILFSNTSADNINKIKKLDQEKKYKEAWSLANKELDNAKEARARAVDLSVQLTKMAKEISNISPDSAGQSALQAVSVETTLINHLIIYNDYLAQLLEALMNKFSGGNGSSKIPELIDKINEEANLINELNNRFNELMKEFDGPVQ